MTSTVPPAPKQHSNYRSLGLIGQGQFGQVYCALHRKTGQLVALKNINRSRLPTHRFLRELRFLLSLGHPHIANCHALEQSATGRQLVLDYCEGGTLRGLLDQEVQLSLQEILILIGEILAALDHAHSQGIVHCDIKPENILLSLTPDGWLAKVSDFGIARLSQEMKGAYTGATGSPAYMAPERFYHQYSEASDLYAVGIVLYELLLGDRPFSGNHSQLMVAHLNKPVRLPNTLPQAIQALLLKALAKLMARRFRNASEMQAAVTALSRTLTPAELQQRFPKPIFNAEPSSFQAQTATSLRSAVSMLQLLPGSPDTAPMLLAATGSVIDGWALTETGTLASPHPGQQWCLDRTVQQVMSSPEGAIAATEKALYRLGSDSVPALITTFTDPITVIAGQHRWLTVQSTVTPEKLWLIDTWGRVPSTPRPFTVEISQGVVHSLVLDNRHLLIAEVVDQTTKLQLLTRWGKPLAQLELDVPIFQLWPSQAPYQCLARSGTHQQDLLIIHLKPFRVMRCRLDVAARWVGELVIGYVGISTTGELRIANFQRQIIGQIDRLPPPAAIAFHPPHHIWLATNHEATPRLHCIDIRDLDLDIVF